MFFRLTSSSPGLYCNRSTIHETILLRRHLLRPLCLFPKQVCPHWTHRSTAHLRWKENQLTLSPVKGRLMQPSHFASRSQALVNAERANLNEPTIMILDKTRLSQLSQSERLELAALCGGGMSDVLDDEQEQTFDDFGSLSNLDFRPIQSFDFEEGGRFEGLHPNHAKHVNGRSQAVGWAW